MGEEGSGLAQIAWTTFLLRTESFEFVLPGYDRDIYVCDFPAVHWIFIEQHSIDIWNISTHLGEKCSSGAHFFLGGGGLFSKC